MNVRRFRREIVWSVMACVGFCCLAGGLLANDKQKPSHATTPHKEHPKQNQQQAPKKAEKKPIALSVEKNSISDADLAKLDAEQKAIDVYTQELSGKGDAAAGVDSLKLSKIVSAAEGLVWASSAGKYTMGSSVIRSEAFAKQLAAVSVPLDQAKKVASDFRSMLTMMRSLSADEMSADAHAKKSADLNGDLNRYYMVKQQQ